MTLTLASLQRRPFETPSNNGCKGSDVVEEARYTLKQSHLRSAWSPTTDPGARILRHEHAVGSGYKHTDTSAGHVLGLHSTLFRCVRLGQGLQ